MKNRFATKKKNKGALRDLLLPVLLFAAIGGLFLYGLNSVDTTTEEERLRSVQQAITKAAVQCYAVEGRYPASLQYLEEHYGLVLDQEKYIIQYQVEGSNMKPTIWVLPRDFAENSTGGGGLIDEDGF